MVAMEHGVPLSHGTSQGHVAHGHRGSRGNRSRRIQFHAMAGGHRVGLVGLERLAF